MATSAIIKLLAVVASITIILSAASARKHTGQSSVNQNDQRILDLLTYTMAGNTNEVKKLIDNGTPVTTADVNGMVPLHHAASLGHHEIVSLFIAECPSSRRKRGIGQSRQTNPSILCTELINKQDNRKRTPLHHAVYGGRTEVVRKLVNKQALTHITDERGNDACDIALVFGNEEIANILDPSNKCKKTP